jgi:hypothetical protein
MFIRVDKMNSGKNLGFVLLFCSLASGLTACGDDYHYLAANVSLGAVVQARRNQDLEAVMRQAMVKVMKIAMNII